MNKGLYVLLAAVISAVVISGCTQQPDTDTGAAGGQDGQPDVSGAIINASAGLGADIVQLNEVDLELPESGLDDVSAGADDIANML